MTKERARVKAAQYLQWAEGREKKSEAIQKNFNTLFKDFDWTEPIKIGHHSQRRHEKMFERRDSMMQKMIECDKLAKRMREKAENLLRFANTNKGDAEAARAEKRAANDELVAVGSRVHDWCFGAGVVTRVNKKTYSIRFDSGSVYARDKSFIKTPV